MTFWTAPADADRLAIDHPILDVWVPGIAQPKGSKTMLGRRKNGSPVLVESADLASRTPNGRKVGGELTDWATAIQTAVSKAWNGQPPLNESVHVVAEFRLPRTASFRARAAYRSTKPDADKLFRLVGDVLVKAGVLAEDSRIVDERPVKRLCDKGQEPGVRVRVWPLGEWEEAGWVLEVPQRPVLVRKEAQP